MQCAKECQESDRKLSRPFILNQYNGAEQIRKVDSYLL